MRLCHFRFPRLALLALVLLLDACSLPFARQPATADTVYLLEGELPAAPRPDPDGPRLWLSPMAAAAGFGDADMVYMRRPLQLEHYAHHRWADAPARMLEPLLLGALEHSGHFRGVAGPGESVRSDLRLDSLLLYLRQVFTGDGSEVQLALRVSLVDTNRAELVASRVIAVAEPVAGRTPYAAAQAADRAVARWMERFGAWLDRHLTAPSPH